MPEPELRPARLRGRDHELDAIVELMRVSLGESPTRTRRFFEWKHLKNPFGPSFVWVAEDEGRLVGLRAMMRWDFRSQGRSVRAVRAVDTATHPDFRRRGLFKKLTLGMVESLGAEGIELVFNTPNEQSRPGYLKMGWREVGRPTLWVRPGGRFSVRAHTWPSQTPPGMQLPREERLHTEKNQAYLRWRFDDVADLGYGLLREQDRAVYFRRRTRDGRAELTINALIAPTRSDVVPLARLVRRVVRSTGDTYAVALAASGTREAAALCLAGFVPVPGRGPRLVVRQVPGQQTPPLAPRLSGWRLQVDDLELF